MTSFAMPSTPLPTIGLSSSPKTRLLFQAPAPFPIQSAKNGGSPSPAPSSSNIGMPKPARASSSKTSSANPCFLGRCSAGRALFARPAAFLFSANFAQFIRLAYHGKRRRQSPVIPRYTRPEMSHVWSDTNRYQKWLDVELAAAETLTGAGLVPKEAAAALRAHAKVDAHRINELEARVRHDVIAFTMAVGESIGDPNAARWLHYGMTSNDVVDTAQALQVQ